MEYNKEGKPRRKRIGEGDRKVYSSNGSEHKSFNSNGGDRRPYSGGEHRSFNGGNSDRKPYSGGEHRSFNGDRKAYSGGERRPYGASNGERRSYGNNGGEHRSFNGDRKAYSGGERRPYGASNGERRSYGNGGEHRSFNGGERRPYGASSGEHRSYGNNGGQRRPYGERPYKRSFNRDADEGGINKMIERKSQAFIDSLSDSDHVAVPAKDVIRLNKFIANSGICSRREADTFIQAGVVTVNGEVVTELGTKINIYEDDIRFNGERLHGEEKVYIVMNKPKGYVTTASDPHADKTVMDLLKGCEARVFAVGRLDKNTTGVLMFTNDGEMAEKLTHPAYDKRKIYEVSLDHDLRQEDFDKIMAGIELTDGIIAADDLAYVDEFDRRKIGIEIHSGKNRIVRRIFESLGYEVKALDRVYFAGLTKKGLKRGGWRYLSEGEVNILKIGSYR